MIRKILTTAIIVRQVFRQMEQVTCCLMFFKGDSITIDKHETTLSNKINNWRLEGLISISEKKSKVRHNSLLVTNQDPKGGLPL